jgi:hypothetical protein
MFEFLKKFLYRSCRSKTNTMDLMSCLFVFLLCCCGECLGGDCICFVCFFISRTVDSNVGRHEGGEDDLEECEEVQGQIAN